MALAPRGLKFLCLAKTRFACIFNNFARHSPNLSFAKTQSGLCFQSSPLGHSPFISVVQSTDFSDLDHCP
jgi:hypothetical protein